ncbi:hypothetical protein ACH5RR_025781 [Cinchona calisaya]|uniref:AIPP2-like SPOC-like domain-containing protein n=1 Tax=Cinchona calisaya TaxID=153742 RepID=A0ABD2Z1Q4_9GENT
MEDHPTSEAHLGRCCDICGDIGVSDAISTCPQCKISCEHLYCMRICCQYHTEDWCCDECERSNEILSPTSDMRDDLAKELMLNTSNKLHHDSARPVKLPNDPRRDRMDREKKVPSGKVKPLSAEEVIMLSSGAKKSCSPLKLSLSSKPAFRKNATPFHNRIPVRPGAIPVRSSLQLVKSNPRIPVNSGAIPAGSSLQLIRSNPTSEPLKHLKPPRSTNSQMNVVAQQEAKQTFKGLRDKNAIQASLKEHMQKEKSKDTFENTIRVDKAIPETVSASSPLTRGQSIINSGGTAFHDLELHSADPITAEGISILPGVGKCLADPSSDVSWKGSFKIDNAPKYGEITDGFQAHAPTRVRRKVYEFSKRMPEVLHCQMVPRGDLWMNLFQEYCLDKRDIGLYFFPSNSKRCENYISLLKFMGEQDLVMKNQTDVVELLIFSSKVLHIDGQKWRGRHFLWGVFHSLKKAKDASQGDAHECDVVEDSNEVIDMEIDMIGGETVGRMDIAVSRESLQLRPSNVTMEACCEIPPGF